MALLHANGQLRTELDGDIEKGQQKSTDDDDDNFIQNIHNLSCSS